MPEVNVAEVLFRVRSVDSSQASYLSINNSAVVSGNQDRSYGFSVRCIQAQGVTVFADPVADPVRQPVYKLVL
jgi:hypothetical protein